MREGRHLSGREMTEKTKGDRSTTRFLYLEADDDGYVEGDPATRIALVWPMTLDTWAFVDRTDAERRLQRNVVRFVRRKHRVPID